MRNVIAFLVALGLVGAIFWLTRSTDKPAARAVTTASGSARAATTVGSPAANPEAKIDTSKVRRLDPETRKRLGEQIAAARERARASATAAGETFSDEPMTLEDVSAPLQEKLKESLPLLAACFSQKQDLRAAMAMMTLTTDPELGTVLDTQAITDADGAPLEAKLDTCLRDAIDSLALPPLGAKAGKLPLQYTFRAD
ncbi:MAG: hypothetical protein M4D80_31175 [Myxococcota bacterium]|nr:hypothetical protein [Myxococcota bacterium]